VARIRSDKPEAYQSETLAEISLAAERTFKGMATIADDRGRLADKPAQINGELWSMRGHHERGDLEAELVEMVGVGLVCRYVGCDGKRYLHMTSWDQHQKIDRPSKSRIPRCPRHPGDLDDCGKHDGDCKPPDSWTVDESSRDSREDSRGLQPAQNGLDAVTGADGTVREGVLIPAMARSSQVGGPNDRQAPDQGEPESSRESREPSMQDLGSRTLDRGSRTEGQVPAADKPRPAGGLTITQRSKQMTDTYAEVVPLCKWPAVNGVVIRAIKAEKYSDDEIFAALMRLAAEPGRSVTIDALRSEIEGLPARDRSNGRGRQESEEERRARQMQRALTREANS